MIDTTTNELALPIPVGQYPSGVASSPYSRYVYVGNWASNDVSIIDASTNTVVGNTIPVGTSPVRLNVSPDGSRIAVANASSDDVSIIDIPTRTVVATIPVGSNAMDAIFSSDSNRVFVSNYAFSSGNTVSVIDLTTLSVIETIDVGDGPGEMALAPDGSSVYVACAFSGAIYVIDTDTLSVTQIFPSYKYHPSYINFQITSIYEPEIVVSGNQSVYEGETVQYQFVLNNANFNSYALNDITCGTNNTLVASSFDNASNTGSFSCLYKDGPAAAEVKVFLTNDIGKLIVGAITVDVANAEPVVTNIDIPLLPVNIALQESSTVHVDFNDAAQLSDAPYSCEFDLDTNGVIDAVVQTNIMSCGTVLNYSEAGVYTPSVSIRDKDGGVASSTFPNYIVIYNPIGSNVSGAGQIWVGEGTCRTDPSCLAASGKAHFGFVSEYKRGASLPTGNTFIKFQAGDFKFVSSEYDWLVVNQGKTNAQFKGTGLVNDHPAPNGEIYRFMIWATSDGVKPDTFRIKIWYESSGQEVVVFDNGSNQALLVGGIRIK